MSTLTIIDTVGTHNSRNNVHLSLCDRSGSAGSAKSIDRFIALFGIVSFVLALRFYSLQTH